MTLQQRLDDKIQLINQMTTKTLRGEATDLSTLDKDVDTLCQDVLKDPQAKTFENDLKRLIEALDHLTTAIKTRKGA